MSDSKPKPSDGDSGISQVPKAVVSRLSLYLRELQQLLKAGQATTNSTQLGKVLGFTDAQVRKDLAYFGQFGYPGIGYKCELLIEEIRRILGTNRPWPLALMGLGNLGRALIGYRGFGHQGFRIAAAFDIDPAKIGGQFEGVEVYSVDDMPQIIAEKGIRLAVLAVPASGAQEAADRLVAAGIAGLLNFAPVTLSLPKGIELIGVDLAIELEQLSFAVIRGRIDRGDETS